MVRRILLLAALSVVATLAFSSVAMAQSAYAPPDSTGDCSGAVVPGFERALIFVPDTGGCIYEGGAGSYGPLANTLNKIVYDPDTGEEFGIVKDLDPDLSSGTNSVTHQELCGDFNVLPVTTTAQQYYEQDANAKERTILDPNDDGQACTAEDGAFLAGDTPVEQPAGQPGSGGDGQQSQPQQPIEQPQQPQPDGQMQMLPDTGGPSVILLSAALLTGGGFFGLVALRRRSE